MLQLHITSDLASDLSSPMQTGPQENVGAMQWYAHRVTLMQHKCVIAMEAKTGYSILFTNLNALDFEQFEEMFRQRLIKEAVTICKRGSHKEIRDIVQLSNVVANELLIHTDSEIPIHDHIHQVLEDAQSLLAEESSWPRNDWHEFNVGVKLNSMFHHQVGCKDYACPLEKFEQFWLDLHRYLEEKRIRRMEEIAKQSDNVIPFKRLSY